MPTASVLQLAEGIELGYALTARAAENIGARALAIKGLVSEAHELRAPRRSADVDLLVEPARFADLVAALGELGWREAPKPPVASPFGAHSVTLRHSNWPNELDVHDRFPGFLGDPADVFDALWLGHTFVVAAGVAVPATDLYGSSLIIALHALRTPSDPRNAQELRDLVTRLSSRPFDRERLRSLADMTGAQHTARLFLSSLGIDVPQHAETASDFARWEQRRSVSGTRNLGWLVALRRTPPWRWPAILVSALLASEPLLRQYYPHAPAGRRGLWLARWWRLKAAVRDLPRAIRAARRLS